MQDDRYSRQRQQCQQWNADSLHQVMAGRARARQFTHAYQSACGQAAQTAFMARWRAANGLPPPSAEAVRTYVTSDMIRHPTRPISPIMQHSIYDSWCAGVLYGVGYWIGYDDEEQPAPAAPMTTHCTSTHLWSASLIAGVFLCLLCDTVGICAACALEDPQVELAEIDLVTIDCAEHHQARPVVVPVSPNAPLDRPEQQMAFASEHPTSSGKGGR
jgi:hypothetical protein